MRKFAVANQKGGSAKTTTAVNLAACLAIQKNKVLLVDCDPQAQATIHLGINPYNLNYTLYDVLIHNHAAQDTVLPTEISGLYLVPSHINLSGAEIELVSYIGRENVLRDKLLTLGSDYDYMILDCPPSLGLLTINALNTVNEIIIPVQAEFFALEGTGKLVKTIDVIRERLNPQLGILGVLITRYDGRKNICKDVAQKVEEHFQSKVFKTYIRDNVKLAEAPSYGKAVIFFAPGSSGSKDYMDLAQEIIKGGNVDGKHQNRTRK